MKDRRLVVFVHVPKTAGITMNQILCRQYGRQGCFGTGWGPGTPTGASRHLALYVGIKLTPGGTWFPEPLQVAAFRYLRLPEGRRARIRAFRGHMSFGLARYLPEPAACFTMMRTPVDQVLSGYYYTVDWRRRPDNLSLSGHIASISPGNLQTRMLAGPYDDGPGALPPPDELLERARRNLRGCAVVGLTERFDETVLLLKKAFGWRLPFYFRTNVNPGRPPISAVSDEDLLRIAADNAMDTALYGYARELFTEQVRQYGPSFERDLRVFRVLNALWQRWHRSMNVAGQAFTTVERFIWPLLGPIYANLAGWGGLRRLVPSRLRPRLAAPEALGDPCHHLYLGERVIGRYDEEQRQWIIRRPYHLFVDISALPPPREHP